MAVLLTNSSEGGTNGTTVTTGNSGGSSGDAYSAVSKGATSGLSYSSAYPSHGLMGTLFACAVSETNFVQWGPVGETASSYAIRGYFSAAAAPTAANDYIGVIRNTSANMATVAVTSASKFRIYNSDGSASVLGTVSIPWGWTTPIRWELRVVSGTTTSNGQFFFSWFLGDSTTAQETLSSTTFNTGTTNAAYVRFGRSTAVASAWDFRYDSLALQTAATGFIGPVASPDPTLNITEGVRYLINASGSTPGGSGGLSYSITRTSGPTVTPQLIAAGVWTVIQDSTTAITYDVTVTESGGSSTTQSVSVAAATVASSEEGNAEELILVGGSWT